jgi:sugar-specific transcriptional regulator TrmB/DNA-binding CsgD family transcriptional regulator
VLESIGLDAAAESVYRALISNPDWTLADLAENVGLPAGEVRGLLDHLVELSLLRRSSRKPEAFRPVSPELGLMNLLAQSRVDLVRREKQIQEARVAIAAMSDEYWARRAREHAVSRLEGQDAVHDRLAELTRRARRECLSFLPGGALTAAAMAANQPADQAALSRGVAIRTVFRDSARNDPATVRYARGLAEAGGRPRTVPELPLQMTTFDRDTALVRLQWGALEVRGEGLLAGLIALFEQTWDAAVPFTDPPGRDTGGLSPLDRALLRLLAEGCTDESAAKRLGLSLRTVRRMTAALLERLEARSRFQAGVRAVQRGWL